MARLDVICIGRFLQAQSFLVTFPHSFFLLLLKKKGRVMSNRGGVQTIRKEIIVEASKFAATYGFKDCLLSSILRVIADRRKQNFSVEEKNNMERLFHRGLSVAVIEHLVENSNRVVHQRLEECFNKRAILQTVARSTEVYHSGRYTAPTAKEVVEEAMITRLNTLLPYAKYWHEAVAIECMPSNAPYAFKHMCEFVDTTCYYAERVESLATVVASGNVLLQSRLYIPMISTTDSQSNINSSASRNTDVEKFWETFVSGIPLSTGPFSGNGWFGGDWYIKRAKVGMIFNLGMLSFIGEESTHRSQTRILVKRITESVF